jgi:hypothetical protein
MLHHYQFEDELLIPSLATKDVIKEQTNRDFDKPFDMTKHSGLAERKKIVYILAY